MGTDTLSKDAKVVLIRALSAWEKALLADAEQAHAASMSKVSDAAVAYFKEQARAYSEAAGFVAGIRDSMVA